MQYNQIPAKYFSKLFSPNFQRHRVVVPKEELFHSKPRQSIAFFVRPDNDVMVECLDGSNHYPPITALEYTKQRFNATYDLKNWLH